MDETEEQLLKRHHIEITGVCTQCGERWSNFPEVHKQIDECEKCKIDNCVNNYCDYEDVIEAIKELEKAGGK